ncbi:LOW QUALITY PROTEIN: hypothetical protein Myrod_3182 [Myroides odoratus DSM 2801]|nr:LOW QUALITY PROTEIN: hypothetical protein Myrod_3182 [Myroides odoratus DSM 2801]
MKYIFCFIALFVVSCVYSQSLIESENYDLFLNKRNYNLTTYINKSIQSNDFVKRNNDTSYIQSLLDKQKIVILPNDSIFIDDRGLYVRDEQILIFREKTVLKKIATDKGSYGILNISNVKNVKIFNANIVGDRELHLNDIGQWGMGILIKDSSEIEIISPFIKDTWGDDYIGGKRSSNENIKINNAFIFNARRNGISIISGENVFVTNSFIGNVNGHSPQSGIDIEPNTDKDKLSNILLENIITYNNLYGGILVVLDKLYSNSYNNNLDVTITISNHTDIGSKYGFVLSGDRTINKNLKLDGTINLKDVDYLLSKNKSSIHLSNFNGLKLETKDENINNLFKTKSK